MLQISGAFEVQHCLSLLRSDLWAKKTRRSGLWERDFIQRGQRGTFGNYLPY